MMVPLHARPALLELTQQVEPELHAQVVYHHVPHVLHRALVQVVRRTIITTVLLPPVHHVPLELTQQVEQ